MKTHTGELLRQSLQSIKIASAYIICLVSNRRFKKRHEYGDMNANLTVPKRQCTYIQRCMYYLLD